MKRLLIALVLLAQFSLFAQSEKHIIPYIDNSGRDVCLAWDNTSGKSVFYNWSSSISNWKPYEINLPGNPLAGVTGKIMMVPYIDKSGRDVCLIWDTKSGKSVFYNWSSSISNWKAYEINLPAKPVPGSTGEIMMAPYIDNSGRDVCVTWDVSTGTSVFYNWSSSISNWKAYEINLPKSPVK